jgi:DNA polymerase-3 subunit chi
MLTDLSFYHLTRTPLEYSLPRLLEKALDREMLSVVLCPNEAVMDRLNEQLWTYSEQSFLPHGSAKEPNAEEQFIYLTTTQENPNNAGLLVTVEGMEPTADFYTSFSRMAVFFDGGNPDAVAWARGYWKRLKAEERPLTYWQQTTTGGWEKKAS